MTAPEDVGSYVDRQPERWRETLQRMRASCQQRLAGYCEAMSYGMPSYARDGVVEIAFAKHARYLSFYVLKRSVLDAHRGELAGLSLGKGCVRYPSPAAIDWRIVNELLSETAASGDEPC